MRRRAFTAGALSFAAAPFAAQARAPAPGKTYRIAVWAPGRELAELRPDGIASYRAFFGELNRLGFIEGRNLTVDRYASEGRSERYAATAREIVESKPDLISPTGNAPLRILPGLSSTIPMVARKAAGYVARILNGEKPGDLPVQQPTKFYHVINLRTAREIGVDVPFSILASADEVIE